MGNYRLSVSAEADLIAIYDHSEQFFGVIRRKPTYLASSGHRRFLFQVHHVYYSTEEDAVVIRAIFHASRDVRPSLFS